MRALFALTAAVLLAPACVIHVNHTYDEVVVEEDFDHVVVDVETGSVELVTTDAEVLVETDVAWTGQQRRGRVDTTVVDGVLYIESTCEGALACSTDVVARLPAGLPVEVAVVTGDVYVEGAGTTCATVTTGSLDLRSVTGDVSAAVTTGDVSVVGAVADEVDMRITTGSAFVELDEPAAWLGARTTSGDVELVVPAGTYALSLETGVGDVDVSGIEEAAGSAHAIEARVTTGSISVEGW